MFNLRYLELKDAPFMLEWMHDKNVTQYLARNFAQMNLEDVKAFITNSVNDNDVHLACVNDNDEYLGTVSLKNIDYEKKEAEYAISFRAMAHHTGAARYATEQILVYAFKKLELERVYLNHYDNNLIAEKFYNKVGFVEDQSLHLQEISNEGTSKLIWKSIRSEEFTYRPLYSFIIISYNNYKYIYEAIDSVLSQDYPNIELIISNDGTPDFDEVAVEKYLQEKRGENIKNVVINNFEENVGTVANVEWCRQHANGEYLEILAADDALYDDGVISRFVDAFQQGGIDVGAYCGRVAMCTNNLYEIVETIPTEEEIGLIRENDSQRLFSRLAHNSFMPTTSISLRSSTVNHLGGFDTSYRVIEDATLYLKMVKQGIPFGWIDMIGARHRDGGISHINDSNPFAVNKSYIQDCIRFFEQEILNCKEQILPDDLLLVENKWKYLCAVNPNRKRFSFIIIGEGNIEDTVRSILKQNYSNIEMIIATKDKTEDTLQWIYKEKSPQVRSIKIITGVQDYVDGLTRGLKQVSGDYRYILSPSSELVNEHVVPTVVDWVENRSSKVEVAVAQSIICDKKTKKAITYYPSGDFIKLVRTSGKERAKLCEIVENSSNDFGFVIVGRCDKLMEGLIYEKIRNQGDLFRYLMKYSISFDWIDDVVINNYYMANKNSLRGIVQYLKYKLLQV